MHEEDFNVIRDNWIPAEALDGRRLEISLEEALLNSHQYIGLACELSTQNAAILRLLLAFVITILSRADENGNEAPLNSADDALLRWKAVMDQGNLSEEAVRAYLTKWFDKFWLKDGEFPFWQSVAAEKRGTAYKSGKLYPDLSESSNKTRLFQHRAFEGKDRIPLNEAARNVVYLVSYDDTASKSTQKGLPSCGAGWLGRLGQIYLKGDTLFEDLMLNAVLLKDGQTVWPESKPGWENPCPNLQERREIPVPDNLPELFTTMSRKVRLHFDGDQVTGFTLLGGDFFDKTDAFTEQFTLWKKSTEKEKKDQIVHYVPARHFASRQLWRDFSGIVFPDEGENDQNHEPGIMGWLRTLKNRKLISKGKLVQIIAPYVTYGDKDFFITNVSSQSMMVFPALLTKTGRVWRKVIEDQIKVIDQAAAACGYLAKDCALAAGASEDISSNQFERGKSLAYMTVSEPFRNWLSEIDPELGGVQTQEGQRHIEDWEEHASRMFRGLENELIGEVSPEAILGRVIERKEKNGKQEVRVKRSYSIPEATMVFRSKIKKLYPPREKPKDESTPDEQGNKFKDKE